MGDTAELTDDQIDACLAEVDARWAQLPAAARERYRNEARAARLALTRPDQPERYRAEGDDVYRNRCWRWEMWYRQEPRPDQSYASPDEVVLYQAWRDAEQTKRTGG